MTNFIILIIQLCGFAFIFVAVLSFLNYMFGWHLGYKGSEIPAEIEFAIAFLVLGLIVTPIGWFLNKNSAYEGKSLIEDVTVIVASSIRLSHLISKSFRI